MRGGDTAGDRGGHSTCSSGTASGKPSGALETCPLSRRGHEERPTRWLKSGRRADPVCYGHRKNRTSARHKQA